MAGTLRFIGIAADYGSGIESRSEATLVTGYGIEGDRYAGSVRQVTIVCTGEVANAATELGRPIDPAATRRKARVITGGAIRIGDPVLVI